MSGFWWENRAGAGVVDFGPFWPQEPPQTRRGRALFPALLTAVNFGWPGAVFRRLETVRKGRGAALSDAADGAMLTAVNFDAEAVLQDDEKNSSTPPAGHPIMAAGGAS